MKKESRRKFSSYNNRDIARFMDTRRFTGFLWIYLTVFDQREKKGGEDTGRGGQNRP